MRNSEGYTDPTAGKALNSKEETKRLKSITAPPRKKPMKREGEKKELVYYSVPAYTSK